MLEPFKLDSLYHLTVNSEYIPLDPPTITKIIYAMIVDFHIQHGLKELDSISLFKEIEWKWMAVRGNLTKRISKWYYEKYKAKLLQETSTAIGNIVRAQIIKNQEYHYDFTKKFDWMAGEFGDNGSCFMSTTRSDITQSMMKDNRFHAVRFYNEKPNTDPPKANTWGKKREMFYKDDELYYEGLSRAWLVKDQVTVDINKKDVTSLFYIIFNGYGMSTKNIASILSTSFGCSYHPVKVTNNKQLHGGLYLNDDTSYIIGEESAIKNIERYDFGLPYAQEDSIAKSQIIMKESPKSKIIKVDKPINDPVQNPIDPVQNPVDPVQNPVHQVDVLDFWPGPDLQTWMDYLYRFGL